MSAFRWNWCRAFVIAAVVAFYSSSSNAHLNTWKSVNVQCSPHTAVTKCYVSEPIRLDVGDRLTFNDTATNRAHAVLEFNMTYDAHMPLIPAGIFETFPHLEQLQLSTGLKELHHDDFENAWNLCNLTLSDNKIKRITSSAFARATNLVELSLDGNEILHLDNDAFNGLDKLYYLSLNKNRLITLKSFVFTGATHLTDLRLENNEIEVLEEGVFDLPNLLFLYLDYNQLKQLPENCFANTQLIGLDLRSNQLTHLGEAIYGLKMIRKLILLNNNHIDDLNVKRFDEMKHLIDLSYDHNATVVENAFK